MTRKPIVPLAAALVCGCLASATSAAAQNVRDRTTEVSRSPVAPASRTVALTDRPADENAIRAMAAEFTRAFGAADTKAIAAMFTDDGEMIDEVGERVQGRAAIEQFYASLFQSRSGATIEITIDSLRFLSPDVAKEEGHTRVRSSGEPETLRRYTVLYVKKNDRWLHSSVREEHAAAVAHHEHLKPLEWLTGEWVDQNSDATVHVSCRWSPEKNFLLRDFTIHVQGRPVMTVNQRIGWDPLTKQIKSWVFDSEGGYGDGLWSRKGNQWVIKSTGVLPDGRIATATHVLAPAGPNSARWSSTERTVGEQNIVEPADYVMVRRAPAPQGNRNP